MYKASPVAVAHDFTYATSLIERFESYKNDLLAAMPATELACIQPYLHEEQYQIGRTILNPEEPAGYVYFPLEGAVVSIMASLKDGRDFEVCMTGREGIVGLWEVLGAKTTRYRAVVQGAGSILKIQAEVIRLSFARAGAFQDRIFQYTRYVLTQTSQTAACNRAHRLEQRLARWLLMTRDRVGASEFLATHESLSNMLGTPRSEVTIAAGILRSKKVISYHRGRIRILNAHELESAACECYKIMNDELARGR
jgi:CRP-like cAMP-binding protein